MLEKVMNDCDKERMLRSEEKYLQSLTMGLWCLSSEYSYMLVFHKLHPSSLTHTVKVYTSLYTFSFFKRENRVAQLGLELHIPKYDLELLILLSRTPELQT